MGAIISFGDFQFNYDSGELIQTTLSGEKRISRLQPQSSLLLQHLIKRAPELVTKEEIKTLLWPNVNVDFDNSLHFCIRQIRMALNDDANNPKYIETIPRRGYRWVSKVQKKSQTKRLGRIKILMAVFISLLLVSVAYIFTYADQSKFNTPEYKQAKIRLAIMPMKTKDSTNTFFKNEIAYNLLLLLGNETQFEVVGPTTTGKVKKEEIYNFMTEASIDYAINGKFYKKDNESSLLVEVIRANDGAHIWVKKYYSNASIDDITDETYRAILNQVK